MLEQSNESFAPQRNTSPVGSFLSKNLTALTVASALLALVLIALGPARMLLPETGTGGEEGTGFLGLGGGDGGIIGLGSSGSGGYSPLLAAERALTRQLVPYTTIPDRPRNEVSIYTIVVGDTLIGIAEQFGLDRNSIFWANSDTLRGDIHNIRPDVDLFILPTDGVYHRADGEQTIADIAAIYLVEPEAIIESDYNESLSGLRPEDKPNWGTFLIVPGGTGEWADWRPPVQEVADPVSGVVTTAFMPGHAGSCSANIAGAGGTGGWINPVSSARLTQLYAPWHSGADLAAPVGTPVAASDTGVVTFSGWVRSDWGYGQLVVLDHGNGWTSYYAHLSSISVGCGQLVSRGSIVGQVGSTGNSSGPHLHFELRWGHEPVDPLGYVGL